MYSTAVQIVRDYLNDVDHLLQHGDAASVAVMAPTGLERMIHALRAILAGHAPDADGRCRRCAARWAWWRQARPCHAWQIAHQHLVEAAPAHPTGPILAVGGSR